MITKFILGKLTKNKVNCPLKLNWFEEIVLHRKINVVVILMWYNNLHEIENTILKNNKIQQKAMLLFNSHSDPSQQKRVYGVVLNLFILYT